ncbi:uncharacterized protein RBU33_024924 [Hipposideros larvatus]
MQRAGACARVCVSVSEGVTEAPTCPARPCCGRRQAEGRGGGCGRRREGARSRGWAPHLPAPPPLDAEAAAATRPRPPCAQAGPAGGVLGGGSPLHTQTNHILLLSGPPNPLNPNVENDRITLVREERQHTEVEKQNLEDIKLHVNEV